MCVSQHRWADPRSHGSSALLLLLVIPLFLLSSFSPLAQGAITIPRDYKEQNILQPPVLTELPESHTAFSLDDISLTCEATGTPTPLFRWTKDGQEFGLERNTSGSFTADVADQLSDYHGDYRCYASNILGTAMTRSIQIITEATPILHKSKKQKKRVDEGDSLILHCSPPKSSTPPLVHWMDNKLLHIGQSERVMTGLDGNLYFANVLKTDSRDDYSCHAQYVHARTILPKEAISVSVTPSNDVVRSRKPHLLRPQTSHSSMMALRGHSLTLECIPRGLPTPRVEWQKKDGTLAGRVENYGRWLHFDSVTQEDDGEYECRAINSLGTTTHPFTVTVEAEPYWEKKPRDLMYAPGETVRLDCLADGIPTPTITWRINGYPITAVDPDPRRSVSSGMLILQNVKYSDTAVYQCEATNKHGNILINTYIYVIELPPQILSSDAMVYQAVEGGDIRLDCSAFGSPLPHVTWESKGMDLLSDPRFSLLTNGTVMLSEASRKDTRTYTCTLRNTNISISAHLEVLNRTVIVNGPPDLRVLRGQAALLDCEFIKDAQLARPQIVWRKDGHKLQEDKHTVFENGTFLLTNVQSDDGGQYSCEVITTLDHAESSGSITVMARPDPPKALSLSEEKDRSLTLSWIPGDSHNSPITAFVVEVREEKHVEESSWRWEEKRNVPGDVNHLELLLQPDSTYSFRVTAVNELGRSKPCNTSKSITTLPAVPDSRPTGVRSNSSNPGTLVIVWDELDKSLHNGPDFLYKVSWRQAEGRGQQWQHVMAKGPPYEVNEVGTYTAFEVKVQAVNSLGEGPLPEPVIGHSGENSPLEPPGGVVTSVTNSTVRVKWNKAQKVRGLLLGYKIYIKWLGLQGGRGRRALEKKEHAGERDRRAKHGGGEEVEEGNEEVRVVVVHSGVQTEEEVTELKLYSHYEVSVTAFNSKGEGPPSPPHHFSTPEGAPGPPASLTFESQSETELTLHWSPPSQPNGILTGYTLQYHPVVESKDSPLQMEEIHDPTVTHFVLQDLDPNRRYLFYLMGRTGVHQGLAIIREGATLLDGVPPNNITMVAGDTSVNLSWVPGDRYRNHAFRVSILRKSAGGQWEESEEINSTAAFYSLTGLQPGTVYHLNITHGNHTYWDDIIKTSGPVVREVAGAFASQGWFIGLISAIVLLMLLLLILCFVKRNKGGKYAVKDKEEGQIDSEARPMKDDTFGEYRSLESDGDEKRSVSQPSLCVDSKRGSDDSLAEYGDSVDIQFNEDGSFIGQYSGRGPVPHGNESSGPASPVNPAPPPPIAPSMSSILNRPL